MKRGLTLMKAEPLHIGHQALINFAKDRCDILYVLLCTNEDEEEIPGDVRLKWLMDEYEDVYDIIIKHTNKNLPYTSESDRGISKLWAEHIGEMFPNLDIIFSSEPYGDYVAEYLGIEHMMFDQPRGLVPISGTMIREEPFKYWDYISKSAKSYFVKKVCICGTESTGESILTETLSKHFNTNYVQEWGREVVGKSEEVTMKNIMDIGETHAYDILEKIKHSNKILFSDTDLNTTKMYSKYFFNTIPKYNDWVEIANIFDLYIYLNSDAVYIQDGTRLSKYDRDKLGEFHYDYLKSKGLKMEIISGTDLDSRTEMAIEIIEKYFLIDEKIVNL